MARRGIGAGELAIDDVERRPGQTAVTLVGEEAGERKFLLEDLGVGKDYMPTEGLYQKIAAADWVHLGLNSNPDLVRRLVSEGTRFSVDLSTAPDSLPLQGVPMAFVSGPDDPDAPVAPLAEQLHRAGALEVVVTCGRSGAYFRERDGTLLHAPAKPVTVVDTCGAGDSFIAAFIAALIAQKRPVPDALREATAAASETWARRATCPGTT